MSDFPNEDEDDADDPWVSRIPEFESRFAVARRAVQEAYGLEQELSLPLASPLRRFIEHAKAKAVPAMVELCRVDPNDPFEIMRLQKEIAAFAEVMAWLSDDMQAGMEGQQQLDEAREQARREEEDDAT